MLEKYRYFLSINSFQVSKVSILLKYLNYQYVLILIFERYCYFRSIDNFHVLILFQVQIHKVKIYKRGFQPLVGARHVGVGPNSQDKVTFEHWMLAFSAVKLALCTCNVYTTKLFI